MKLRETLDAIFGGMDAVSPTGNLLQSESHSENGLRLVASNDPRDTAQRRDPDLILAGTVFEQRSDLAKAARARWRIYEAPVSYSGRTYEEGKKIGMRDALTAVCAILYYRFFD